MNMHAAYQKKLSGLHLPHRVLERVEPIVLLLQNHAYKTAEREIALLFVESIKKIRNGEITPKEADAYFTALGILIEPVDELKLSKTIQDILFVGELFHDAGKDLSSDIKEAARAALSVLMDNPLSREARKPTPTRMPVMAR